MTTLTRGISTAASILVPVPIWPSRLGYATGKVEQTSAHALLGRGGSSWLRCATEPLLKQPVLLSVIALDLLAEFRPDSLVAGGEGLGGIFRGIWLRWWAEGPGVLFHRRGAFAGSGGGVD